MITGSRREQRSRGIVLVLVLAMLGLLALIGITFATFSGQARVATRNFLQSTTNPVASDLMDFALAQLIGDTNDVRSVIRGHSMARDMYGNDAANNGYLASNPAAANGQFQFSAAALYNSTTLNPERDGLIQCTTNTNRQKSVALTRYSVIVYDVVKI
jgi:hypothetical protein